MIPLTTRPRSYPRLGRNPAFLGEVKIKLGQMDAVTNLAVNGALLQVQVSPPAGYGGGTPKVFTAMVDSGASITCINMGAAQQMDIPQVSSTQLGGVGGMTTAPIYAVALTLPEYGVSVDPVQIAGVGNPLPGVDMLIGRDLLRLLEFDYQGSQGAFTIKQRKSVV